MLLSGVIRAWNRNDLTFKSVSEHLKGRPLPYEAPPLASSFSHLRASRDPGDSCVVIMLVLMLLTLRTRILPLVIIGIRGVRDRWPRRAAPLFTKAKDRRGYSTAVFGFNSELD